MVSSRGHFEPEGPEEEVDLVSCQKKLVVCMRVLDVTISIILRRWFNFHPPVIKYPIINIQIKLKLNWFSSGPSLSGDSEK